MLITGNQKRKESELNDESPLNVIDLKKTKNMEPEKVAILDAGAQYAKLIDRRVRELAVKSDLLPLEVKAKELCENNYRAIIISGGPKSVYEDNALTCDPEIFKLGLPILGICYGMHIICRHFGGIVKKTNVREDGEFLIEIKPCLLFKNMNKAQKVLLTHGDSVETVPENFEEVAKSSSLISGIANDQMRIYGVQFHPEVDITENGHKIFSNFLYDIAGLSGTYTLVSREAECINYIRSRIGSKKAILLISGGVDSSVCAALLQKSLRKDQIIAIHIDNGFMRRNESAYVKALLSQIGVDVKVVIAGYKFKQGKLTLTPDVAETARKYLVTKPLCLTTEPEEKRRIIGDVFVKVFEEEVQKLNLKMDDVFLVQGTLRPDLIESGSSLASGSAAVIKTHHNDTNMIRYMRKTNRVVEPLRDFHKDEVKKLALDLNLPSEIVHRKPFPGPGLAIRILCSTGCHIDETFSLTETMTKVLCQYAKKRERQHALFDRVNSYLADDDRKRLEEISRKKELFSTLLPIKTVGVQGDCRSYSHAVVISCDQEPDWDDLSFLAQIIPRVCHNVNRVCYAFGKRITEPVRELTRVLLTDTFIDILREADYRTATFMEQNNCEDCYSQFPVVLIPVHFDRNPCDGSESCQTSIVLRPFCTNDFMTGRPALPGKDIPLEVISKMVEILSCISRVSRILYDLTLKPPGTVEWE